MGFLIGEFNLGLFWSFGCFIWSNRNYLRRYNRLDFFVESVIKLKKIIFVRIVVNLYFELF